MKKRIFTLMFALLSIVMGAKAQVVINEENFPDEVFRNYLLGLPYGEDGVLSNYDINNTKEFDNLPSGISDLTGIKFFTNLRELYYSSKTMTLLDVSDMPRLSKLWVRYGGLVSLNVSGCNDLVDLHCEGNQLLSLDLSGHRSLYSLTCNGNQLNSLNLTGCGNLKTIDCADNSLSSIDISDCTKLTGLWCNGNSLTSLDCSGHVALQRLSCGENHLATINLSGCTGLSGLYCSNNHLTTLDLSDCSSLEIIYCFCNWIGQTGMEKLVNSINDYAYVGTGLAYMYIINTTDPTEQNVIYKSQVNALRYKNWKALDWRGTSDDSVEYEGLETGISIDETNFPDENFRNYLLSTTYGKNGILSDEEIAEITTLNLGGKKITSLKGIKYFTALKELNCAYNQLTSLDVSGLSALEKLTCRENKLASLDISGCISLQYLFGKNNRLTTLDLSGIKTQTAARFNGTRATAVNETGVSQLVYLDCQNNQLTSLDVSGMSALQELSCSNNQLSSLNISGCTSLQVLSCNDNRLTTINVSEIPSLTELICYRNCIGKTVMGTLVESLPSVSEGYIVAIDTQNENEENVMTQAQVAAAVAKGWTVYDYAGGSYAPYEGATGIDAILKDNGIKENDKWYTIDGYMLEGKPTQKGVYIVNGIKVVIK